jgi:hypothetical protein
MVPQRILGASTLPPVTWPSKCRSQEAQKFSTWNQGPGGMHRSIHTKLCYTQSGTVRYVRIPSPEARASERGRRRPLAGVQRAQRKSLHEAALRNLGMTSGVAA